MLRLNTEPTERSQEFREILWTLVQEKERDSFVSSPASRKNHDQLRIWIERLLLVLGFALLVVFGAARLDSFFSSRTALNKFFAIASLSTSTSNEVAEVVGPSRVDFSQWDGHREQAYEGSPNKQSGAPLAVLHIAKIGLEVPLLDGTDGLTLNQPGNIGIAGHRDGFFRGLKDIGLGDTIDLKAPQGTTTYAVDEINIVSPSDASVLRPRPAPSLTLITCYPFYFIGSAPQRYVVHASRIGFEPQKYNSTEQGSLTLANKNY